MNDIEIKLPSDPQFLKIIRSGISHLGHLCSFSSVETNAIIIAVDEAISNIIKHTYGGDKEKTIVVHFRVLEDRFEVVLRDFGEKIDPKKIKSRDLDDIKPGGLGVHLIRSNMDVVNYDNTLDVGNQLTLAKYFPGRREGKDARR